MTKIKAIVFDWGGVLSENIFKDLMKYMAGRLSVPANKLEEVFNEHYHDLLTGHMKECEAWEHVCSRLGVNPPDCPSLMTEAFRHVYEPKNETLLLVKELKERGYITGLLSDAEIPAVKFFYEQEYILFDAVVFSSMVKHEKPEREVYELLLKELGTKAEETVFFDDFIENVEGARAAGLHSFRYESVEETKRILRELGVRI